MMRCRICGAELKGALCPDCGFDRSLDRERYPTLINDGRRPEAVWVFRQRMAHAGAGNKTRGPKAAGAPSDAGIKDPLQQALEALCSAITDINDSPTLPSVKDPLQQALEALRAAPAAHDGRSVLPSVKDPLEQALEALRAAPAAHKGSSAPKPAKSSSRDEFREIEERLSGAKVGSTVRFGAYKQDSSAGKGKEPIEWMVLAKKGGRLLVISKYALDCKRFHEQYEPVSWERCTLRSWLNGEFLEEAFSAEERSMIPLSPVRADMNPRNKLTPVGATKDRVFLLSIPEVEQYFASAEVRCCAPTDYAVAQRAFQSSSHKVDGKAACWWWLRSPGSSSQTAASVYYDGAIYYHGNYTFSAHGAVRPALWIDLGS